MNKNLTKKKRASLLHRTTLTVAWLLIAFATSSPAWAAGDPVVKVYECPQGQARIMADNLRNEYGVIPGVRVAADERTARVIVQAPPEVQSRISQRMAAAYPDLQAPAEKPTATPVESRDIQLNRLQADQLESQLWSTLGNRLSAVPEKRATMRGYRLATSGSGSVTIWIDFSNKQVKLEGAAAAVAAAARLIAILDMPQDPAGKNVRLMPLQPEKVATVKKAAAMIRTASGEPAVSVPLAAMLLQQRSDAAAGNGNPSPILPPANQGPAARPEVPIVPGAPAGNEAGSLSRIVNPVQLDVIDGLDIIVLRGSAQDVEQMMEIVRRIEEITKETEPSIEILMMKNIECDEMAVLVKALYDEVYQARQGAVSITPLVTPDAILIVGRQENVKTVKEIVARLDQPAAPGAQFQVFHLKYAGVVTAAQTIQSAFPDTRGGLNPSVHVTTDPRSTALIVQASPRDMAIVADLIRQIDIINVPKDGAVNEVRIIRLNHTIAANVAQILKDAIGITGGAAQGQNAGQNQNQGGGQFGGGQPGGQFGQGGQGGQFGQPQGQNTQGAAGAARGQSERSAMLQFLMVDAKSQTQKLLSSGILREVTISPDTQANSLIISSPPENMELLEGLVKQLDDLPAAEAQIKVFTVVNGDAQNLSNMLTTLFTGQATGAQAGPQALLQLIQNTSGGGETSVVPLRFGVDSRTNSVIASGTMADLAIVEAILTKLDDGEVRKRKTLVIRLKNAPAQDVANSINQFLTAERQATQSAGAQLTTAVELLDQQVVVVGEPVTNSLVLSATPRYFDQVKAIIEQLDTRPPMVMIQVLIASVDLGSTNEFGIELGLQDSVLFDRSILSNLQTTSTTLLNGTTTQTVVSANAAPGFNFNNGGGLGNPGSIPGTAITSHPPDVGGQGIANFGVGNTNSNLGYSGLVLSAASQNVSAMLRALAENHRVDILQRPEITTLDNQPAFVQVGQRVPTISAVNLGSAVTGTTNSITFNNVGTILLVTPRISPDGLVVMQIDAEKSSLEPEATGIPIFTSPSGQVTRSPIIDATTAQTTVAAMSGQTIVIGGLITKSTQKEHHGVPVLDDIPVINNFFRYDSSIEEKTELLIIMTPHIIKNQAEADALKRAEAAKMTWCINDVTKVYGEVGLRRRTDEWTDGEVPVIYPDNGPMPVNHQPAGPEMIPAPSSQPAGPTPAGQPPVAPQPHAMLPDAPAGSTSNGPAPMQLQQLPQAAPSIGEPMQTDPSAANGRYPAMLPARYMEPQAPPPAIQPVNYGPMLQQAPPAVQPVSYGPMPMQQAVPPAVQPVNYGSTPGQQNNSAQPAVYQSPSNGPTATNFQQPSAPYGSAPPAYYGAAQGNVQR